MEDKLNSPQRTFRRFFSGRALRGLALTYICTVMTAFIVGELFLKIIPAVRIAITGATSIYDLSLFSFSLDALKSMGESFIHTALAVFFFYTIPITVPTILFMEYFKERDSRFYVKFGVISGFVLFVGMFLLLMVAHT